MGTQLTDGKLTINATYGVTVNRGDYSSEKFSLSIGIEYDVDGDSSVAFSQAEVQQTVLAAAVKQAVIGELGLEAKFDENGTFLADFGSAPKAAPQAAPSAQARPASSGGGGGSQFAPPKISKEIVAAQPTITADLDGRGISTFRDLRGLKAAPGQTAGPGQYSAKAADFRDLADAQHQVWVRGKDGQILANVAAAIEGAGGTVQ